MELDVFKKYRKVFLLQLTLHVLTNMLALPTAQYPSFIDLPWITVAQDIKVKIVIFKGILTHCVWPINTEYYLR